MRTRKVLALLLALAMALSLLPLSAMAVIIDDPTPCPNSPWGSHDYWPKGSEPRNCQHGEIQYYQCQYCGKWQTYDDYDTGGHDYQSVRVEPTCTQDGYTCLVCSVCGDVARPSTLPATGHTALSVAAKSPTCTDSGYTAGAVCSVCGTVLQGCSYLAPLGHDYQLTYSVAATCTTAGYTVYTCSRCGATYTDSTAALGHNWGSWKVEYPGTCVYPGMYVRTCSRCGLDEYVYGEYGDHDWGEWTLVYAATATTDGLAQRVCKNDASHVEYYVIPATGEPEPTVTTKYVLKGVEKHFVGVEYDTSEGYYWPDGSVTPWITIWQDAEPDWFVTYSSLYTDSALTTPLDVEPVPGETYYFCFDIDNEIDRDDHSVDFTQIDPAQVNVTMDGFTVTLLNIDEPRVSDNDWDYVNLHFSATYNDDGTTGTPTEEKAELTIHLSARDYFDHDTLKDEFLPGESVFFLGEVENTGNVPLEIYDYDMYWSTGDVILADNVGGMRKLLNPGEKTAYVGDGYWFISMGAEFNDYLLNKIKATSTETATLIGTYTYSVTVRGYKPGTDEVLCEFDENCTVGVLKGDETTGGPQYVLKGATQNLLGVYRDDSAGYPRYWPKDDGSFTAIWQDAEPTWFQTYGSLYTDPAEITLLDTDPVVNETYYFFINVCNYYAYDDHSIDFSQVDPAQVNVTMDGFTVTFLGSDPYTGDDDWDYATLHFSALYTGDGTATPAPASFYVDVVDATYGAGLAGGQVEIRDAGGTVVDTWTPDNKPHPVSGLPAGDYTVVQTVAPEGFILAADSSFTVGADGAYTTTEIYALDMNNDPVLLLVNSITRVEILKVSAEDGTALSGAHLQIIDENGYVVDEWDTTETAHIVEGLKTIVLYTIHESAAPEGFALAYDEDFSLWPDTGEPVYTGKETTDESGNTVMLLEDTPATEVNPAISVYIWADPGAGDGKRYEGAIVPIHFEVTNTGDCPVYTPWWSDLSPRNHDDSAPNGRTEEAGMGWGYGVALLNPSETYTLIYDRIVDATEASQGYFVSQAYNRAWYYDANGDIDLVFAFSNDLHIDLTGPEPEPDVPALEIQWTDDYIYDAATDTWYYTTAALPVLEKEDSAYALFDVINNGNVPLTVYTHAQFGNGHTPLGSPYLLSANLAPGKTKTDFWGAEPIGNYITSGTENDTRLGLVTITFWATGHDPVTGEQLCETEHLTRTWEIAKHEGPTPWPIPNESSLMVSITRGSLDIQVDAAGHQLGEDWDTNIFVQNVGPVDVDGYELHVEYEASNEITNGGIGYSYTYTHTIASLTENNLWDDSPWGTIVEGDVTRGFVKIKAYVTWTDPDSGDPRVSNTATLYLPVISKTGLLLIKGIAKGPDNHKYFQEGEPIQWTLTVTNTSDEPISNVKVTDDGLVVGEFAVINPAETVTCTVPAHVVTAYEADVALTVTNIATATGTDLQGAEHTWPSNPVSVPTNEKSPDPVPPITPGKDPGGDPGSTPIDPPETPDKDKKQNDTFAGDGGDSCKLTLDAMGNTEMRFTLHTCADHLAAAQAAEAAAPTEAVSIWRGEIEKLYSDLAAAVPAEAQAAVTDDATAFWAYVNAYQALYGDEALADVLRLRCAELCCMLHTAPEALPASILGEYARIMMGGRNEFSARSFGEMKDGECEVSIRLSTELADAMNDTRALVLGTPGYAADEAFYKAAAYWQMALDKAVNAAYKAADRDGRKLIAGCRQALDQVYQAREALLTALYPDHPETVREALMNLYRDAAIDATSAK